jgi:hypothetical protein
VVFYRSGAQNRESEAGDIFRSPLSLQAPTNHKALFPETSQIDWQGGRVCAYKFENYEGRQGDRQMSVNTSAG